MSFNAKVLPLAFAAALLAACSDVSAPTRASSASSAALGKGGISGGSKIDPTSQLVITTPPAANISGKWVGTSDGPDVVHTYTYTLNQTNEGIVTGIGVTTTPFMTSSASIVGTVNGDTLVLYIGTLSAPMTYSPIYRGLIAAGAKRIDGAYLNGGVSPVTLFKQ